MHRILPFVPVFVCLLLFACARNPKPKHMEQSNLLELIQEGTTTKAEVEALLGPADGVSFADTDSRNEMWTYRYKKKTVRLNNIPYAVYFYHERDAITKELAIAFNSEGVVLTRSMRETRAVETGGIFGSMAEPNRRLVQQHGQTPLSAVPRLGLTEVAEYNRLLDKYGTFDPPDVDTMPEFTPDVVRNSFIRNQKEADAIYGSKWMKVRGTLAYGPTYEGGGGLDMYCVGLESKGKLMSFLFFGAKHQEQLSDLKHGQTLVIVGVYTPDQKHLPKLIGCTLVSME